MTNLQVSDRISFLRVDKAGEEYRVLDEEDRCVVAHQIPDTILGVEFDRKTTWISANKREQRIDR